MKNEVFMINSDKGCFLKKLIISILITATLTAGIVFIFDPFFHYHKPIRPLKAVLTQAEYQVIGTLRTFDYDSLIAGSSMAENYNNKWFDDTFGCTAIKAVKPGANTSDLVYLLEAAYEEKKIKNVFYTLDISAITTSIREHYVNEGMPLYLYNKNPFDDVKYIFNKHVIFEDIPYMIANSFIGDYDEGNSFNWAQYKQFNTLIYDPIEEKQPEKHLDEYGENVDFNLDKLENLVKMHPETKYIFMVPPYSTLWWHDAYMHGDLEQDFYALNQAFIRLLPYENVEIHYFQNMEEIISDLTLYMDLIHYHPDVNKSLVDLIATNEYKVTLENKDKVLENMRIMADKCITEYAEEYLKNKNS